MRPKPLVESFEVVVPLHESLTPEVRPSEPRYVQQALPLNRHDDGLPPLKGQLLKWIGNKQKFAKEIISYLPKDFGAYHEPFLGSGAVLAHLAPSRGVASDIFKPLVEIWQQLHNDTEELIRWYADRHALVATMGKEAAYEKVKASYNAGPNGADLLFLSRVCYGGVVRFRKADGYMSTPCGPHKPMSPESFAERARVWAARTRSVEFLHADFEETMRRAQAGDVCYLDPPYADSQAILYGAQRFSLNRLFEVVEDCKRRGVRVALSLDGTKKSGDKKVALPIPHGLFEREVYVQIGRSMLRRFQMDGQSLEAELVTDRLLLTY
ncbi:DNA adenine methylase [Allosphingosinicella vermicomposti]|uniref:DNA adenine methylase n=1 Tax=Allosphingosinicella vermicomposti TaxID=614671 RepID=UPI000D10F3B2|nr:DNA adenine methylase [Allosphingosinicella vermicomposti]